DHHQEKEPMLAQPEIWAPKTKGQSIASFKVFTTLMLHTWRQRREEVRNLQEEVRSLQTHSMKSKNKLHVCDTIMRVEKRRNSELLLQLKQSARNIEEVRSSCEFLESSVSNMKAERARLQIDLQQRNKEFGELEEVAGQTKRELFGALMEQRSLQSQLSKATRVSMNLQQENEQLIREILMVEGKEAKFKQMEACFRQELAQKDEVIRGMRLDIALLDEKLQVSKEKLRQLDQLPENKKQMEAHVDELRRQIDLLQARLQSRTTSSFFGFHSPLPSSNLSISRLHNQELVPGQPIWTRICWYSGRVFRLFWMYLLPGLPMTVRH
ncbi:hypothetical protein KR009_007099, partial [Drosophila setifemur]